MITSLPAFYDMQYTDKDGKLSKDASLYMDQTFQVLNMVVELLNDAIMSEVRGNSFTLDGITPPPKSTVEITGLEPSASAGTIWFNSDIKKLQFKSDTGVVQTITSA